MEVSKLGQIQITQNKILIVEGVEEERFFNSYMEAMGISGIQVLPIGGKTKLRENLHTLIIDPNFVSMVSVLIITRDADESAASAFESVCSALESANLPVPKEVLREAGTNPRVKVMIIPPESLSGKLEDMCLQSVINDKAMPCVDSYFSCLGDITGFTIPNDLSKAKVHVFLSCRKEPDKRLGEAAEARYWPFDSSIFNPFKILLTTS